MKRINSHLPSPFRYGEKSRRHRVLIIAAIVFAFYGAMVVLFFMG